jgi:hypothetical protein
MKWLVTALALASLITTPALASRQHLSHQSHRGVTAPTSMAGCGYVSCRGRVSGLRH